MCYRFNWSVSCIDTCLQGSNVPYSAETSSKEPDHTPEDCMTPLTRTSVSHNVLSNSVAEEYKVQLTQTHRAAQTWKKLLAARQGTKLLIFYGNPKSLPFSQRPAIGTFSKPDHTTHFLTYFNTLPFLDSSFSIQVSNENFVCTSHTSLTSRYTFPVQKSSFI